MSRREWGRARRPYPGSSLTAKAEAVPVSTMADVVAMATILPTSRIVRTNVSTQEGQEGNKTLTHALSLWTAGLAGPSSQGITTTMASASSSSTEGVEATGTTLQAWSLARRDVLQEDKV